MARDVTVPTPTGLVVIARAISGKIITRITSHRDLVGAMHTARCVLTLKLDAVQVEVHHGEHATSDYLGHHEPRRCACGADPVTGRAPYGPPKARSISIDACVYALVGRTS
jgi:hypothetical protein